MKFSEKNLKIWSQTQIQSFRMTYYCTVINKKTYQQCNSGISQIIFKKIWTLLYRCCHSGYIFQICNALRLRHQLRSQILHVKKSVKTNWWTKISWKTVVLFCLKAFFQIIFPLFFPQFLLQINMDSKTVSKFRFNLSFLIFLKEAVL